VAFVGKSREVFAHFGAIDLRRFAVMHNYDADCTATGDGIRIGEVYHVVRNNAGGSSP